MNSSTNASSSRSGWWTLVILCVLKIGIDSLVATSETPPRLHGGGFGLASTMSDYMRFLQMLLNGGELEGARLLSPKTIELILSDNLPAGVEMFFNYGYGLGFYSTQRSHPGWSPDIDRNSRWRWGGQHFFGLDRADDITWMVWAQALPCCQWKLNNMFETLVHQAIID